VAAYNDLGAVERLFDQAGSDIAAIIVEPVAGNMGVVPPVAGFLEGLRQITRASGALLIFDEVMTGFRVHPGGAQALFGLQPDLTTLGKVIGGGLPVGAYGGRRDIMQMVAPAGPMYQAGTLSGNPLTMAAGIATLKELQKTGIWETLLHRADSLGQGCLMAAHEAQIPLVVQRVGTMFTAFFTDHPVRDWASAKQASPVRYGEFFRTLLEEGVYLAPSQYEAGFLSTQHGEAEIAATVQAVERALHKLAKSAA
jgi:glutamate-1-semialdehyde 2,1-aminomutase